MWLELTAAAVVIASAGAGLGLLYRRLWLAHWRADRTPTGFGALLAPVLLLAALATEASPQLIAALAVSSVATFIYWFDDFVELGAWLRVGICAIAGLMLGAIYFAPAGFPWTIFIVLELLAAFVMVAAVNTVNFQDGADLNLATFILLTAVLLLVFAPIQSDWPYLAVAMLAFVTPFALLNSRPRTLYFGDSGSFAFAALFTIMGASFLVGAGAPPPEAAIPAALPVLDTIYVTAIRIRIRQAFTTRHYFHLYQRLQRDREGFAYLVPQVAGVALSLAGSELLQMAGLGRVASVALAMVVAALAVFLASHALFVVGEPGPPRAHGVDA